jgi:hypothetical protein
VLPPWRGSKGVSRTHDSVFVISDWGEGSPSALSGQGQMLIFFKEAVLPTKEGCTPSNTSAILTNTTLVPTSSF